MSDFIGLIGRKIEPYLLLIEIAAGIVAVVLAIWWWSSFTDGLRHEGYDNAAAEYGRRLADAKDNALATERALNAKLKGAIDDRTKAETLLAAARAAALAADDRLRQSRDDFRQRLSTATVEAARDAAGAAADLLGECSREYRQLAAAADGHLADLSQCEAAWPE